VAAVRKASAPPRTRVRPTTVPAVAAVAATARAVPRSITGEFSLSRPSGTRPYLTFAADGGTAVPGRVPESLAVTLSAAVATEMVARGASPGDPRKPLLEVIVSVLSCPASENGLCSLGGAGAHARLSADQADSRPDGDSLETKLWWIWRILARFVRRSLVPSPNPRDSKGIPSGFQDRQSQIRMSPPPPAKWKSPVQEREASRERAAREPHLAAGRPLICAGRERMPQVSCNPWGACGRAGVSMASSFTDQIGVRAYLGDITALIS
jgi:hypothetical protein